MTADDRISFLTCAVIMFAIILSDKMLVFAITGSKGRFHLLGSPMT